MSGKNVLDEKQKKKLINWANNHFFRDKRQQNKTTLSLTYNDHQIPSTTNSHRKDKKLQNFRRFQAPNHRSSAASTSPTNMLFANCSQSGSDQIDSFPPAIKIKLCAGGPTCVCGWIGLETQKTFAHFTLKLYAYFMLANCIPMFSYVLAIETWRRRRRRCRQQLFRVDP